MKEESWETLAADPAFEQGRDATELFVDRSRTIVSTNQSPDVPFDQSINPYKGCEHGCVYCFARPTHEYLDLSLGRDFESKIFYKPDGAALLKKHLEKPSYRCQTIALGVNTDAYQPLERTQRLTRALLEVLLEYQHPVSIVTKGSLILRDLDVLSELARQDLVSVMVSLTSLDGQLKNILEPRAAAPSVRLEVIRRLRAAGVRVGTLLAPIIPFINDAELEDLVAASARCGAKDIGYVMLRLPYQLKALFSDWLEQHFPMRRARVLNTMRDLHGDTLYRAEYGQRMRGQGTYAQLIETRFRIAKRKHLGTPSPWRLCTSRFRVPDAQAQLSLSL